MRETSPCDQLSDVVTQTLTELGPLPGFWEFALSRCARSVTRRFEDDGYWVTLAFQCKVCQGLFGLTIPIMDDWDGAKAVEQITEARESLDCRMSEQCKMIVRN